MEGRMEGRDFPAGHFQPGKYYPSHHLTMAPHSGSGLMGSSSASFMGTILASSLGSTPSHPSGAPSSPSSPSFRGGAHSSASQIWFPHSHEGYSRFTGSLTPTFLPMSPLDPHGNGNVLYGQHCFYDSQKDFYLRSLQSQPPLISANHSLPPLSRTTPAHPLGSCSRERDCSTGGGVGVPNKGSKDAVGGERLSGSVGKEKERGGSKQESKERHHHGHQFSHSHHPHHAHLTHSLHTVPPLDEDPRHPLDRHKNSLATEYKDDPSVHSKHLSACLLNAKMQNGDSGTSAKGPPPNCIGAGSSGAGGPGATGHARNPGTGGVADGARCCKEGLSREMRISESPSDCLKRGSAHTHSVAYTVPPPPPAVGGSWLHPGHHHHHSHHHHHPHPDLFCPPPPPPLTLSSSSAQDKGLMAPRDSKVTGPTYVPSVGPQGDKTSGHFQLGNPHWRGGAGVTMTGSGGGTAGTSKEAKAQERSSSGTHGGRGGAPPIPPPSPPTPASSCQRKPSPQQEPPHTFGKADRGPEWPHNSHVHHPHLQLYAQPQTQLQTQHRSCSLEYVSGGETTDLYRPSLPQGAKAVGHSGSGNLAKNGPYASTPPFRDCSHSGPLQNPHKAPSSSTSSLSSMDAKGSNNDCALRDGQKVARIRHQQHTVGAEQGHDGKRRPEVSSSSSTSMGCGGQQAGATSSWGVRGHPRCQAEDDHHKAYTESIGNGGDVARKQGLVGPCEMSGPPAVTTPRQDTAADHSNSTSTNAIRSLMKYSSQSLPLSHQKSPFGGLGCLKQGQSKTAGNPGGSCVLQDGKSKQGVGSRRGSPGQGGERLECSGRTSRDAGDSTTEGEVRQPPVGIAVAVARQREPPCRPPDGHPIHSRHGRVVPSMKGMTRPIFPLDRELDEERKREEQLGIPPLDRELLIRDNKERVEIARIHPSSSCHGDLTSHLIVPGGASQLGADAPPHAHPHWAGSPSLWMTGHSYRIGHAALHQNLGPGFSTSMPGALQPVLSLPQDPSAALVVLPSEPSAHPAHHLDMLEQPGLWPPVYGGRGPAPHMQHPAVYSRTQFLQHPDLYALQHQHQQHRAAQALEIPHRHAHPQRKPEDPPVELDNVQSEPRAAKAAKPFSYSPANKNAAPSGACTARLSPCYRSSSLQPHPKSTPCPVASPAVAAPRSPALSPAPPHLPKAADTQDKRAEGQPPQDYPQSLEPDLPPGYTYPAITMAYKASPSPQEVQLAEHADLEAEPAEPVPQPQPLPLPQIGEEPEFRLEACPIRREQNVEEEEPKIVEVEAEAPITYPSPQRPDASPRLEAETLPEESAAALQPPPTDASVPSLLQTDLQEEPESGRMVHGDSSPPSPCPELGATAIEGADGEAKVPGDATVQLPCSPQAPPPLSPPLGWAGQEYPRSCIWSLELLIAAALCATRDGEARAEPEMVADACPAHRGMELLSELAELQRCSSKESSGEEQLTFDLHSLATIAAARALEVESPGAAEAGSGHQCPIRRTLNLRRKCKWTPRHEPVCPVKGAVETMDGAELAMRVRLAELQRRYKEKQKELTKLQRKHEQQKEETSRSPARRGPGRPRKRKSTPGPSGPVELPKRIKSVGVGLSLLGGDDEVGGVRKKISASGYERISAAQVKVGCRPRGRPCVLASKLSQQAKRKRPGHPSVLLSSSPATEEQGWGLKTGGGQNGAQRHTGDGANAGDWAGQQFMSQRGRSSKTKTQTEARWLMEKEASVSDSQTSEHDEEDDGSLESDEGLEGVGGAELGSRSRGTLSPFSSSAVKPEATCSSKSKKETPGRVGAAGEEAKVRGRPVGRPPLSPADRKQREVRPAARWRTGGGATCFGRSRGLKSVPSPGERLKKATRKSGSLQCILGKRSGRLETPPSQNDDISWSRRGRSKQVKGRAVSRLLESFAADEDFRIDEQSSFSEEEEEEEEDPSHTLPAVPDCVLTKERLVDGLKVLISKEDELLYAAYVHTLDLPDIYSVAIEGERGNRPRIYSLEQLLEEAVLDVRPESQAVLTEGTRVCAYWSERSRCLYPGYVHRGGPGEEEKDGCVMVEFDDGDRGWISLANVRLLPPGYQIHCAEPSPALLTSPGRQSRRSSAQEKTSQDGRNPKKTSVRGKPGRPKMVTSGTKACVSESVAGSNTSLLSWPAVAATRKRPLDLFHFNGIAKKTQRGRESDLFPLVSAPMSLPAKGIFSTSFEVDSFSSIANGYSSFGSQPLVHKSVPGGRGRRPGDRKEFLVKLDHEGVTSPKTKNGKALLLLGSHESGGARLERSFGSKGLADVSSSVSYSHPALPVKDSKKSSNGRAELLLKGSSHLRKPPPGLGIREYGDYCHSDCSYSDMDEEEDEDTRRAALVAARGELRSAGRFLSRLSVSSSSSGSSSSSSSGSLSSSSLCSSDNDSSYSSDDEETSRLMLQGCLSSRHALLQQQPQKPAEAPSAPARHAAFGVSGSKDNADGNPGKPGRRKDPPVLPPSKTSKDGSKKQKTASPESPPSTTPFLPARQLWRWSGNPTQRRGMKGKARKLFYKAVVRGKEVLRVGDCAVFLSAGRPQLPYIGRIESLWESWASNMVVKVKWFYHPEETKLGKRHRDGKHALYQSCHEDENDIQTISHKCQVVSREEYERLSRGRKPNSESQDLYYLAGTYDPTSGQLVTVDGVSIIC